MICVLKMLHETNRDVITPYHTEITKDNNKSNQDIKQEKKEKLDETAASNLIHIKSSAMTTIKKSSPTSKDGGMVNFSVEGDERISFVRFELPSSDVSNNGWVEKATLNLFYCTETAERYAYIFTYQ